MAPRSQKLKEPQYDHPASKTTSLGAVMSAQRTPGRVKHPIYKGRSIEGVCMLVGLVGYEVPVDDANLLSAEQLRELEVWAERTHLRASDNIVRAPARPAWLPGAPWQGPPEDWGRGPTPVDCAAIAKATGSTS
jgi:hypothetical protein